MPSQKKIETVEKIKEGLKETKSLIVADYQGLNTSQLDSLKKEVEKAQGRLRVAKNTLLKVALADLKLPIPEAVLKGPTAIITSFDEGLKALKVLADFAKSADGHPSIKMSFLENRIYDAGQSLTLSSLPGREILVGRLLGLLNSPLQRLVSGLKYDQRKLVFILRAVSTGKLQNSSSK